MRALALLCGVAAVLWLVLFATPVGVTPALFWPLMALSTGGLAMAGMEASPDRMRGVARFRPWHVPAGIASAVALYAFCFAAFAVGRLLLPFLEGQVVRVYVLREGVHPLLVGALLLFWIGPAEEIFWRGFVQRRMAERFGALRGLLLASAVYAGVHVWTGNLALLATAFLCGIFWGAMFLRFRSLWPGMVSHGVWDVLIFVALPLG